MTEWWNDFTSSTVKRLLGAARRFEQKEADIDDLIAGGGGILHQATVTLDNDQIIALPNTPVTIGDAIAPGLNKVLVLVAGRAISNFTSAYGNIDPTFCGTQITGGSTSGLVVENDIPLLGTTGQRIAQFTTQITTDADENGYVAVDNLTSRANLPLRIRTDNNGAGPLSLGHIDNTLLVTVSYHIFDVTTGVFE